MELRWVSRSCSSATMAGGSFLLLFVGTAFCSCIGDAIFLDFLAPCFPIPSHTKHFDSIPFMHQTSTYVITVPHEPRLQHLTSGTKMTPVSSNSYLSLTLLKTPCQNFFRSLPASPDGEMPLDMAIHPELQVPAPRRENKRRFSALFQPSQSL